MSNHCPICKTRLYVHVHKAKVQVLKAKEEKATHRRINLEKAIAMRNEKKMTYEAIAREFGCSYQAVYSYLKRNTVQQEIE